MKFATTVRLFGAAAVASLLLAPAAQADSGFYLGASVGDTSVEFDDFDENDTSWKAYGGYIFDMPVLDFAVELAYLDFGSQGGELLQVPAAVDADGIGAFGLAGMDFGVFGWFVKVGYVSWDADLEAFGLSGSDDGTDLGYGLGFRLNFSSIELRAEYELHEFDDADVDMATVGVVWRF
ncbi:MAG: outer membrane beta-barrel protein [Woeseiaceae bacterium]|nr:outer membrane beta-barrel protein [Woeseiaceae bacterium]